MTDVGHEDECRFASGSAAGGAITRSMRALFLHLLGLLGGVPPPFPLGPVPMFSSPFSPFVPWFLTLTKP